MGFVIDFAFSLFPLCARGVFGCECEWPAVCPAPRSIPALGTCPRLAARQSVLRLPFCAALLKTHEQSPTGHSARPTHSTLKYGEMFVPWGDITGPLSVQATSCCCVFVPWLCLRRSPCVQRNIRPSELMFCVYSWGEWSSTSIKWASRS